MCRWMSKVESINESCLCQAVALINIFKYIDGISKKLISNLSFDEEISLWKNRIVLSRAIYH